MQTAVYFFIAWCWFPYFSRHLLIFFFSYTSTSSYGDFLHQYFIRLCQKLNLVNQLLLLLFFCWKLFIFGYHMSLQICWHRHHAAVGVWHLLDTFFFYHYWFGLSFKAWPNISFFFLILSGIGGALVSLLIGSACAVLMVHFDVDYKIFKSISCISPCPFGILLILTLCHLFLVELCDFVHLIYVEL